MARKDEGKSRRRNKPKKSDKSNNRYAKERIFKSDFAQESSFKQKEPKFTVEQKKDLDRLLEGIGKPEPKPFVPDDFQIEALEAIETQDVLVTAPTGSGKTWIAREEIRRLLEAGKRAWYTTPLKALTNSKYMEFGEEFGEENVGILTGDRKENADAPIIVGTTEIYRNQLFDALRNGEQVNTDFVIIDEAHYLADEYRGHVWEEAIILSPPRI
ncbi:MAG: DEAD/DEAH box helicase, partial [Aridibacter sp.]